jgi:hypothetical protein
VGGPLGKEPVTGHRARRSLSGRSAGFEWWPRRDGSRAPARVHHRSEAPSSSTAGGEPAQGLAQARLRRGRTRIMQTRYPPRIIARQGVFSERGPRPPLAGGRAGDGWPIP